MSLSRSDFAGFFAAVRAGQRPFAWQERLLDHLLTEGRWPDRIVAPTGTGKTAVVDVHVFATALTTANDGPRLPRRLALVVDRRFVVDSHADHAQRIAALLTTSEEPILRAVADALSRLHLGQPGDPLLTVRLRGGSPPPRSWRDRPEACAVLACTPDMWGSRLLFGGYGSARLARPREAGLLALDSVVVVDEAHLSRQLMVTARRVRDLQELAVDSPAVPLLQVVTTTATPDDSAGTAVGVEQPDLAEPLLARRMTRPKPVRVVASEHWPVPPRGPARTRAIAAYCVEVEQQWKAVGPTTGCIVNRVDVAVDIAEVLRERGLTVELLVGRMRPADVARLRKKRPGLLTVEGDPTVDVLVATQTVEVGIDLDLAGLVTDLAPGTALAQRAGRVNRLGLRDAGPVVAIGPAAALPQDKRVGPYQPEDLDAASRWLLERADHPSGLAPWVLRTAPPPGQSRRRRLFQRPEPFDAWLWARTSERVFAEPDLDLWLADDLTAETDVGLVVRHNLPNDLAKALDLVRLVPPRPHEVFPLPIGDARRIVGEWATAATDGASGDLEGPGAPWLVWRAREVEALSATPDIEQRLRPGDVLILPTSARVFRAGVVSVDGAAETAEDVAETGYGSDRPGWAGLRIGHGGVLDGETAQSAPARTAIERLLAEASGEDGTWDVAHRLVLGQALEEMAPLLSDEPLRQAVTRTSHVLRKGRVKDADIDEARDETGRVLRIVVIDQRRATADEDVRQTWTRTLEGVSLEQHQRAVADRAAALATALGLGSTLAETLGLAGAHHDDGKADRRFQSMLGNPDAEGSPLAKSARRTVREEQRAVSAAGLPTRWRHEQLSALRAWQCLHADPADQRALAVRLVGTTHGWGRPSFPHSCDQLLDHSQQANTEDAEAGRWLFDEGWWDELVEATDRRVGVWGTAYLEAVLRAADGCVSGEGS